MIIDTHCHLDDESFFDDLDETVIRAEKAGVEKIIIPGADMNDLQKAQEISHKYDNIYFAAGVHPYHHNNFDINYLKKMAMDEKCVAIGECGLDYYRLKDDFNTDEQREVEKANQKRVFLAQIDLASELKKPLIVHIRDANQDSFDILNENAHRLVGGVLHCYNSSKLLLDLKDRGFYFGIGGVLTFKNAKSLVEILPQIPLSNLLIETDAPYLAPVPNRGKRNEPSYTTFVVDKMSEILNINKEKLEEITTSNAKKLFLI